jgi:hypothetical protein
MRVASESPDRRNADQITRAPLLQMCDRDVGHRGKPADVDGNRLLFRLPFERWIDGSGAGTDHEQLDVAHLGDQLSKSAHRVGRLRYVNRFHERPRRDFTGNALQKIDAASGKADVIALRSENPRQGAAYAGRSADDDGVGSSVSRRRRRHWCEPTSGSSICSQGRPTGGRRCLADAAFGSYTENASQIPPACELSKCCCSCSSSRYWDGSLVLVPPTELRLFICSLERLTSGTPPGSASARSGRAAAQRHGWTTRTGR